jgi:hypothetical protein
MKKWLIRIGILLLILIGWVGIFLAIMVYEIENHCGFWFIKTPPFIECSFKNFNSCHSNNEWVQVCAWKPLILLYPQKDINVDVSLSYISGFFATFPEYDPSKKGWSVLAHPDGTLIDQWTHQDTYGLFWEGNPINSKVFDLSKWFIVRGSDIRDFLYSKLTEIGLNTKEKSDFIMFWYPKLQNYPYIQITFAWEDYADIAKLDINPKPDSLLRVFMVAKPLTESIQIPEQKLQKFERKWFSVVEWGGTIVK